MRWGATITRCCARRWHAWPTTSPRACRTSTACSWTPGRCSRKPLARNAGLGWIGKHTNLIARDAGSYFFLGEILTDLPLPVDEPASAHCGSCSACMPACPTQAIVAPYQLDARRCISYLTIELRGSIPEELRAAIGNRIYGCDDCQLVCPWNKFARAAAHPDFKVRHQPRRAATGGAGWAGPRTDFEPRFEGSAIRRIGYEAFMRNVVVALGNGPPDEEVISLLAPRCADDSALIAEHVRWALDRLQGTKERAVTGGLSAAAPCRLSISRALPRRAAVRITSSRVPAAGAQQRVGIADLEVIRLHPGAAQLAARPRP